MTIEWKAVVLDWSGTMVDFGSCAPVVALRGALQAFGVTPAEADLRADMGRAKPEHVARLLLRPEVARAWARVHGRTPSQEDVAAVIAAMGERMEAAALAHAELVPGAARAIAALRARGVGIGSCTGYSRQIMDVLAPVAAAQGYAPDVIVCAGETAAGRPSPLMVWKNLVDLGAWPAKACVKVDDAETGVAEGRAAGVRTVGVAVSGNSLGLSREALAALPGAERRLRIAEARERLWRAGADVVIDSVAELPAALDALAHA